MKKKVLSVLLASTMMAGILAGCGSSGSTDAPAADASTEAAAEKTAAEEETAAETEEAEETDGEALAYAGEINLMHYSTSEESEGNGGSDGFRTMIANWEEAHPDITLNQNVLANAE